MQKVKLLKHALIFFFNLRKAIYGKTSTKCISKHRIEIIISLIIILSINTISVYSQDVKDKISFELKKQSLDKGLQLVGQLSKFRMSYTLQQVAPYTELNIPKKTRTVEETLNLLLEGTNLTYSVINKNIVLEVKKISQKEESSITPEHHVIQGIVTNLKNESLPGTIVKIKGTSKGTMTDSNGEYRLEGVGPDTTLVFSLIGYKEREEKIRDRYIINTVLQENFLQLNQIVVTGYQNVNKEKVTGSISTISRNELEQKNVVNLLDNLEGRVSGLIYYNGTPTIRGVGTLQASTNVLIVVDGLPIEGSVEDLNPYDIERVTVLKDAAATAIYGARASNGVIVITTRNAGNSSKTSVEFSSNFSYFQKPDYTNYHYMTPSQQVDFESKYYNYWFNSGSLGTTAGMINTFEANVESGAPVTPVQYAHYQLAKGNITASEFDSRLTALKKNDFVKQYRKNVLSNQLIQQYNLAVRSGGQKTQSNLILNYTHDNTGVINAYNQKLNLFYKGIYTPVQWVSINYGVNSVIGKNRTHYNTEATNPFNVPSYYNLLESNGSRSYYSLEDFNIYSSYNTLFDQQDALYSLKFNHLDELERDYKTTNSRNTRYFVNFDLKPLQGLTIKPQFQYEDNSTEMSVYSEFESYSMRHLINTFTTRSSNTYTNLIPASGRYITSNTGQQSYTARGQIDYEKNLGKNEFLVLVGTEFRQVRTHVKSGALFGYDDQLQVESTATIDYKSIQKLTRAFWSNYVYPSIEYSKVDLFSTSDITHRYASGYANFTYTYDKKYNMFGSYRKDYADLFGGDKKYKGRPLWSTGASWLLSEADFMKNLGFKDYLKIRMSYGVTGNIATNYTSQLTATLQGRNPITGEPIANVTSPPNSKLRWEKTSTTNIGFDFAFLGNSLQGSLDWYQKKGSDLLATKRLDATQGFTTMIINNGNMRNNGVELSLKYDWLPSYSENSLAWTTSLVMSYNKNKITHVDEIETTPATLAGSGAFRVGNPVNSLYSYQYRGLDETGLPQWLLSDGTLTTSSIPSTDIDAVVFSGGIDPTTNISLTNDIRYRNFGLSVFVVYYGGHYLRDNPPLLYNKLEYGALPNYLLNSWTPDNTDTDIPGFGEYYQEAANANPMVYADHWVKHADFLKIRNIILTYNMPQQLAQKIGAKMIRLRFQVDNPNIIWTRDKLSIDPETLGLRIPTSYILGLNVNF